jgi:hypothetical protein
MDLEAHGHPLHTRALGVSLAQRDDAKLDARGYVFDIRKRGFVPVAGELHGSGLIHDMRLAGVVDPAGATLESLAAEQRNVAFEPSAVTAGESCRDPADRIRAMSGSRLDAGYAPRLRAVFGGALGCSHLLTLGHLLGTTSAWALERDRALHGPAPARRPGECVFRRDLVVDGQEPVAERMQLVAQLTELVFAPAPAVCRPMDRFAAALEVRALIDLDPSTGFVVTRAEIAERRRGRADLADAAWRARDDVAASLVGIRLWAGAAAQLLGLLGDRPDDRPLLDLLLMLAPTIVQCAATLSEPWVLSFATSPSVVAVGGLPDSCYMWRRDGALDRVREAEGGTPKWRA